MSMTRQCMPPPTPLEAMQLRLQAARGALADISVSADMKLHLARRKAGRVYIETAPPEEADPV